jgi:hypothetical protein
MPAVMQITKYLVNLNTNPLESFGYLNKYHSPHDKSSKIHIALSFRALTRNPGLKRLAIKMVRWNNVGSNTFIDGSGEKDGKVINKRDILKKECL